MTRVLVTGATGFIGGHIVRALLDSGYEVRALVRPGQALRTRDEKLTLAVGDVRDRASLDAAMVGCNAVVHAAAAYNFWSRDPGLMYDVNVDGTRNVLQAAAAGVERIVYTSTVATMKLGGGRLATEEDSAAPRDLTGAYKRSKWEAERMALRMVGTGAHVVIVNPTAPVGSADVKPTPTGGLILRFLRGEMPAVVDTGLNLVHVRDVAEGHVLALERGKPGERYLLGNTAGNLTLAEIVQKLSEMTGLRPPRWKLPHGPVLALAHVDTFLMGDLLGRQPHVPSEAAKIAVSKMWVDPSKAVRELGLPQRRVDDGLSEAVHWFIANGYVAGRRIHLVGQEQADA
ncbi:MAG: hopanoid-associated sugar epimerase [Dehalococcoidia bacterium]